MVDHHTGLALAGLIPCLSSAKRHHTGVVITI